MRSLKLLCLYSLRILLERGSLSNRHSPRALSIVTALETIVQQGVRPDRVDVAESLMAASRVKTQDLASRQKLIASAGVLLGESGPLQLQVELTQQRSTLMRLAGDIAGSIRTIQTFLSHAPHAPADVLGPLYVSQAKNFAFRFAFSEAHHQAKKYAPVRVIEGQSELLWDHIYGVGRILRGEGRFDEARECFELCLKAVDLGEARRLLILSATADLYCELDYRHGMTEETPSRPLLWEARHWLIQEVYTLESHRRTTKGFRRILLSLIEIQIRLGCDDEARHYVDKALSMYGCITTPDIVDRLGHVRTLMAAARVSDLENAARFWADALRWNRHYNPSEEEVFTCGVVHMYLCLVRLKLGDTSGSSQHRGRAWQVFATKERQFLIPGVGTYLIDSVVKEVQVLTGWSCEI